MSSLLSVLAVLHAWNAHACASAFANHVRLCCAVTDGESAHALPLLPVCMWAAATPAATGW
jgi:hypothetical protein